MTITDLAELVSATLASGSVVGAGVRWVWRWRKGADRVAVPGLPAYGGLVTDRQVWEVLEQLPVGPVIWCQLPGGGVVLVWRVGASGSCGEQDYRLW